MAPKRFKAKRKAKFSATNGHSEASKQQTTSHRTTGLQNSRGELNGRMVEDDRSAVRSAQTPNPARQLWRSWEQKLLDVGTSVLGADAMRTPPQAHPLAHWQTGPEVLLRVKDGGAALPAACCPEVLQADINRSAFGLPKGPLRELFRRQLRDVTVRAIADARWPEQLHYYQGTHDVFAVLLDVAWSAHSSDRSTATPTASETLVSSIAAVASVLLHTKFARFARRDMRETLSVLCIVHELVLAEDPSLARRISCVLGPGCHFAISWVITWCAHDLSCPEMRLTLWALFDAMISDSEPDDMGVVYFAAALILKHAPVVLDAHPEWTDADQSFGEMFQTLKSLPRRAFESGGPAAVEAVYNASHELRRRHSSIVGRSLAASEKLTSLTGKKSGHFPIKFRGIASKFSVVLWASITVAVVALHYSAKTNMTSLG